LLSRHGDIHDNGYRIPNLERYIEVHPELFIQAIVWTYKRKDKGSDPSGFLPPQERTQEFAERGYKLLDALRRIPGHDDLNNLQTARLSQWVSTVRRSSAELDRDDIADSCIGKLLAHAAIGNDGVWPCEVVRDVMEEMQSEPMMEGARIC